MLSQPLRQRLQLFDHDLSADPPSSDHRVLQKRAGIDRRTWPSAWVCTLAFRIRGRVPWRGSPSTTETTGGSGIRISASVAWKAESGTGTAVAAARS